MQTPHRATLADWSALRASPDALLARLDEAWQQARDDTGSGI